MKYIIMNVTHSPETACPLFEGKSFEICETWLKDRNCTGVGYNHLKIREKGSKLDLVRDEV